MTRSVFPDVHACLNTGGHITCRPSTSRGPPACLHGGRNVTLDGMGWRRPRTWHIYLIGFKGFIYLRNLIHTLWTAASSHHRYIVHPLKAHQLRGKTQGGGEPALMAWCRISIVDMSAVLLQTWRIFFKRDDVQVGGVAVLILLSTTNSSC